MVCSQLVLGDGKGLVVEFFRFVEIAGFHISPAKISLYFSQFGRLFILIVLQSHDHGLLQFADGFLWLPMTIVFQTEVSTQIGENLGHHLARSTGCLARDIEGISKAELGWIEEILS